MATSLEKSLVPVRLSLRYSNGIVLTHSARALRYDENSLRILSSQPFERGATLSVLAPFVDGIATCWVFGISGSTEQPGYFELDLQFVKKPVLVPQSPAPRRKLPRRADRVAAQEAIETLITGLYRLPPPPFSQVIRELPPESRSTALVTTAAAVIFILQRKGLVNLGRLIEHVREAAQQ
jgi:hypothetical protein